jgi:hypothetical protein
MTPAKDEFVNLLCIHRSLKSMGRALGKKIALQEDSYL